MPLNIKDPATEKIRAGTRRRGRVGYHRRFAERPRNACSGFGGSNPDEASLRESSR